MFCVMTLAKDIQTETNSQGSASNFTTTLKRILELLDLEAEDDYGILKPTDYAFKMAMNLVVEAYEIMGNSFPLGSESTDEKGGIRIAWQKRNRDCNVRLFCPSSAGEKAYIYHNKGDESAVEYDVSASNLFQWLEWFNTA